MGFKNISQAGDVIGMRMAADKAAEATRQAVSMRVYAPMLFELQQKEKDREHDLSMENIRTEREKAQQNMSRETSIALKKIEGRFKLIGEVLKQSGKSEDSDITTLDESRQFVNDLLKRIGISSGSEKTTSKMKFTFDALRDWNKMTAKERKSKGKLPIYADLQKVDESMPDAPGLFTGDVPATPEDYLTGIGFDLQQYAENLADKQILNEFESELSPGAFEGLTEGKARQEGNRTVSKLGERKIELTQAYVDSLKSLLGGSAGGFEVGSSEGSMDEAQIIRKQKEAELLGE